jgi:pimeloyl-ACP methyl ester carboxylesterase
VDVVTVDEESVQLPGASLAVRRWSGALTPFLLVHGLASNARTWDGVAAHLAAAGHEVVAVDQRGHGRSPEAVDGYDTPTAAADLADLVQALGWTGPRAPVVAGQSWGANVVLRLAADHPAVARAVALVDGGWISPGRRFATFEQCWDLLAPPLFEGLRYDDIETGLRAAHADWPAEGVEGTLANLERTADGGVRARLARDHHRDIVRSLWSMDAADDYPRVRVPLLAVPAGSAEDVDDPDPLLRKASAVAELLAAVPGSRARWYPGGDHDLHCQHPAEVAADLLDLLARAGAHPEQQPTPESTVPDSASPESGAR